VNDASVRGHRIVPARELLPTGALAYGAESMPVIQFDSSPQTRTTMATLMFRDGLLIGKPHTERGLRAMLKRAKRGCDWRCELVLAGTHSDIVSLGFVETDDLYTPRCAGITWAPSPTLGLDRLLAIYSTTTRLAHRVVWRDEYAVIYGDGSIYTVDGADCTHLADGDGTIARALRSAEEHLTMWTWRHGQWHHDKFKRPFSNYIAPSRHVTGEKYGEAAVMAYCGSMRCTRNAL